MTDDFVVELGQCWKRVSFTLHILRRLNWVFFFSLSCHTVYNMYEFVEFLSLVHFFSKLESSIKKCVNVESIDSVQLIANPCSIINILHHAHRTCQRICKQIHIQVAIFFWFFTSVEQTWKRIFIVRIRYW